MAIMEKLNVGAIKLGLHLSSRQLEQFSIYYQELLAWNQRMNLTAITDYEEVQILWSPEKAGLGYRNW